jgi:hypothetical protein
MTLAEQLQAVADAKKDIRLAISSKGNYVDQSLPFSKYADKIRGLEQTLSGDGFGAVIGTPSGDYYLRVDVYFYNSYLDNPRFFASPTVYGPYTEVTTQPITVTETTTMYVFASDGKGENFTSIFRFVWDVRGTFFEDIGVLPDVSALTLTGSDKVTIELNVDQKLYIPPDMCAIDTVLSLVGRDNLTIERR